MTQALIQPHASLAVPIGNLDAYISAAYQLPLLTLEEERHLAIQLQEHSDLNAARTLITHHLRFVVKIARSYSGYGLALGDLIQEGNVGLMKAVRRFDPNLNVRLVSFAVHWIRAEIHEFILRNWRIVKVATTKAQRKLFFNLRSAKKRLGWLNLKEVESVATDLGVTPNDVIEMENRLNSYDVGFDLEPGEDPENYQAPLTYLTDRRFDPARVNEQNDWDEFHKRRLRSALETLDKRSRDILTQRWLSEKKPTLGELAEKYQVSAERIRQLEGNAIKKLRNAINS